MYRITQFWPVMIFRFREYILHLYSVPERCENRTFNIGEFIHIHTYCNLYKKNISMQLNSQANNPITQKLSYCDQDFLGRLITCKFCRFIVFLLFFFSIENGILAAKFSNKLCRKPKYQNDWTILVLLEFDMKKKNGMKRNVNFTRFNRIPSEKNQPINTYMEKVVLLLLIECIEIW